MSEARKQSRKDEQSQRDGDEAPAVPRQFVSAIKSIEQQVGEHVIGALQQEQTVAVLTTVTIGPDGAQRIISVGLDMEQLGQVNDLLLHATTEKTEEVPCVGFHCYVKPPAAPDAEKEK